MSVVDALTMSEKYAKSFKYCENANMVFTTYSSPLIGLDTPSKVLWFTPKKFNSFIEDPCIWKITAMIITSMDNGNL